MLPTHIRHSLNFIDKSSAMVVLNHYHIFIYYPSIINKLIQSQVKSVQTIHDFESKIQIYIQHNIIFLLIRLSVQIIQAQILYVNFKLNAHQDFEHDNIMEKLQKHTWHGRHQRTDKRKRQQKIGLDIIALSLRYGENIESML